MAKRMPQPPPGWKPKSPVSTVEKFKAKEQPDGQNSLRQNLERLENLERLGFIKDWDWEDGIGRGIEYFIILLNGIEIKLKGGHIPAFYLGAMSVQSFYRNKTYPTLPEREINLFIHKED